MKIAFTEIQQFHGKYPSIFNFYVLSFEYIFHLISSHKFPLGPSDVHIVNLITMSQVCILVFPGIALLPFPYEVSTAFLDSGVLYTKRQDIFQIFRKKKLWLDLWLTFAILAQWAIHSFAT